MPDSLDVLFLDTLHTHEHVKAELETWGGAVKPGGCVLVHDTDIVPDVARAVREWAAGKGYDVVFLPESNGLGVVNVPPVLARVAAIIPNFNMSEAVDGLVERIAQTKIPLDVIVVDDGSARPSKYTTLALRHQLRPNRARLMGLHYADYLAQQYGTPYFAYWLLATSARFADDNPADILAELVGFLQDTPDAACVLPAYTADSRAPWAHLLGDRGTGRARPVWFVEWTAALLRADWFDSIGRLDAENKLGWGTEYEPALWARQQGLSFYVHEGVRMVKDSIGAHEMGRRRRSVDEYWQDAGREMERILGHRYGPDWLSQMTAGNEGLE
uniref:Putative methyltransferase n=1 Tax=viral metagenome TaxID=1070528 RepID=A0A6M3J4P6_9ZZZZ